MPTAAKTTMRREDSDPSDMGWKAKLSKVSRRLLILPPVLLGAAVLFVAVSRRNAPQQVEIPEAARPLLVIEVPQTSVVPRVIGYGTARPGDIWSAVAEVKGRIVETHPELNAGAILREGELVAQIDPTEYELRIAQLQAELAQTEAQQAELKTQATNYQDALDIEAQSLRLAESEMQRLRELRTSNAVTESQLEETMRMVLGQRQSLQSLENSLRVLPAQQKALQASYQAKQAALDQAKLDLEHTTLRAPFDCRLSDVSLEVGQFVAAGEKLFEAYGAAAAEVEVQVPIDQVRKLLDPSFGVVDLQGDVMQTIRSIFDVDVFVRLESGNFEVEWQGRFDRVREGLDLQTRTVRVVVTVDRPFENVIPGKRPPLTPGMYCEVEFRGRNSQQRVVVPRTSLWEGGVYLVDDQQRLQRCEVQLLFAQGSVAVIAAGLEGGETLVVSDPTPAIEGMLVEPTQAKAIEQRLISEASGEETLR